MIVYLNGHFIPKEEVTISPDDRGFLFADGVYEVIRSYYGRLFQSDWHLQRLDRSLRALRFNSFSSRDLQGVGEQLIEVNALEQEDALIYIQVTRGVAPRRHAFPNDAVQPTVYATAYPIHIVPEKWERGVKIILVPDHRWTRCDIKSISLLPNILANQLAKENGAEEAVFVRDGAVTEGSLSNFAAVFSGKVYTYPQSFYILSGITRNVVLRQCQKLNIPVEEHPVLEADLPDAEEIMLWGTTAEVLSVVQVNDWIVGDGKPGPISQRLQKAFREQI